MCGRFSVATDQRTLEERFSFTGASIKFAPSYNVARTDEVLTVTAKRPEYMRWGLVPGWAKSLSIGSRMINAKAETIADRPSFRAAFRKRRCLVVADGYYPTVTAAAFANNPRREAMLRIEQHHHPKRGLPIVFSSLTS